MNLSGPHIAFIQPNKQQSDKWLTAGEKASNELHFAVIVAVQLIDQCIV
jgi:hypothetical protein